MFSLLLSGFRRQADLSHSQLQAAWRVAAHRRDVLLLHNPHSGPRDRSRLVTATLRLLRNAGYRVHEMEDLTGFLQATTDQSLLEQLRCVIAAGGDGTSTLVATYLPPHVPLAPLPLGNENVMAHWLGYRRCAELLVRTVRRGAALTLDAGEVNGRLFLFVLTCGFDAQVVQQTHQRRRGHAGHWAYVGPLLRTLIRYPFPEIRVTPLTGPNLDAGGPAWTAPWLFVFNMPCYAMGIPICRSADPSDGLLDACTFPPRSVTGSLYHLALVLLNRHQRHLRVRHVRVSGLRIESDCPLYYQFDGDPGGQLPIVVRAVPQRWSVLLPAIGRTD